MPAPVPVTGTGTGAGAGAGTGTGGAGTSQAGPHLCRSARAGGAMGRSHGAHGPSSSHDAHALPSPTMYVPLPALRPAGGAPSMRALVAASDERLGRCMTSAPTPIAAWGSYSAEGLWSSAGQVPCTCFGRVTVSAARGWRRRILAPKPRFWLLLDSEWLRAGDPWHESRIDPERAETPRCPKGHRLRFERVESTLS